MLKNIKVTNFRSLDNFYMEFNEGLNVIIGENDAGKIYRMNVKADYLKPLFESKPSKNAI